MNIDRVEDQTQSQTSEVKEEEMGTGYQYARVSLISACIMMG